jgi:hypothetical protein
MAMGMLGECWGNGSDIDIGAWRATWKAFPHKLPDSLQRERSRISDDCGKLAA